MQDGLRDASDGVTAIRVGTYQVISVTIDNLLNIKLLILNVSIRLNLEFFIRLSGLTASQFSNSALQSN